MKSEFQEFTIDNTCRSCLSNNTDMQDLFSECEVLKGSLTTNVYIYEMLTSCTQIQISQNDGFPRSLCSCCVQKVISAFLFHQQTKRSDEILKEYLQSKKYEDCPTVQNPDNVICKKEGNCDILDISNEDQNCIGQNKQSQSFDEPIRNRQMSGENLLCDVFDAAGDYFSDAEKSKKKKRKKAKDEIVRPQKSKRVIYPPLYEFPLEPQKCSECSEKCDSAEALVKHRAYYHAPKKYQCLTCGNAFTTTRGLRIHQRQHTGEKPEVCSICGKTFTDPRTLKSHERIHNGNQRFPCTLCDKKFSARGPLESHMTSHRGERPFVCLVCQKSYVHAVSLQVHMRSHSGVRPYKCNECDMSFITSSSLSVHKLRHTGIKKFVCGVCGKRMGRSGQLKVHMRRHSGEKPFSCSTCSAGFSTSGQLKSHTLMHTGIKNFVCWICGKKVGRAMELIVHLRVHSDTKAFPCPQCPRTFSTLSNMKLHQRKHTGEKPYKCDQCHRSFADSHVLKNHRRIHTGEKPYSCGQCQRSFTQQATLRSHLNTHFKAAQKAAMEQNETDYKECDKMFECTTSETIPLTIKHENVSSKNATKVNTKLHKQSFYHPSVEEPLNKFHAEAPLFKGTQEMYTEQPSISSQDQILPIVNDTEHFVQQKNEALYKQKKFSVVGKKTIL